ncbi:Orf74 [Heliothis zea nudivirus]|uniref:Orf74 n=1 Tax=Heliothis zea nudivirus 1 TaxID=3116536 RepID=Q8JKN8_9VIRU|nr:Orf74 [Heliothis zea nudivirus]AAN04368.1 Orf74 [Heliothis zea nudivirus]
MIYLDFKDLQKLQLPDNAWTEELIDQRPCFVLRNPVYCRVFWMHLWRARLVDSFRKQQNFDRIENVDLDRMVVIDAETGALLSAPASVNSLETFERLLKKDTYYASNVLLTGVSTTLITVVYVIVVIVVVAIACYTGLSKKPPKSRWYDMLLLL